LNKVHTKNIKIPLFTNYVLKKCQDPGGPHIGGGSHNRQWNLQAELHNRLVT
jgi:hypothetical protein